MSSVGQRRAASAASDAAHSLEPGAPFAPMTAKMLPRRSSRRSAYRRDGWRRDRATLAGRGVSADGAQQLLAGDGAVEAGIDLQRVEQFSLALIQREPDETYARGAHSLAVAGVSPESSGESRTASTRCCSCTARASSSASTTLASRSAAVAWVEQQRLDLALGERGQREDDSRAGHGGCLGSRTGSRRWTRRTLRAGDRAWRPRSPARARRPSRGCRPRRPTGNRRGARVRVGRRFTDREDFEVAGDGARRRLAGARRRRWRAP